MYRRRYAGRYARTFLISLILSILAAVSSHFRSQPEGQVLKGSFRVVDGDTLTLGRQRLRLLGLDAPEHDQWCGAANKLWPCGEDASRALRDRVDTATACEGSKHDKYGRLLVTCSNAGGDIGAALVRQGFAVSYSGYREEEREAREAKRGLWSGPFERPADWRKDHGGSGETSLLDWIGSLWR